MKNLKLNDFLPNKEPRETIQQVKMSQSLHKDFRAALTKRKLKAQDVLLAAVKMFIAETEIK